MRYQLDHCCGFLGFLLSCLWMIRGIRSKRIAWQLGNLIREEKGDVQEMHEKILLKPGMILLIKTCGTAGRNFCLYRELSFRLFLL